MSVRLALKLVVRLEQVKTLIGCMTHEQKSLLLSTSGSGKSEIVYEASRGRTAGLWARRFGVVG